MEYPDDETSPTPFVDPRLLLQRIVPDAPLADDFDDD